ncbi:hypothetical protein [Acidithiobacillus sp.]|jgi:hypothetical protein|uniref:hypothetical protein n=1 Tax=Acidithiobacillus sp. TaxID=1872118 RepID=UPI0025B8E4B7|nr:hypothetical protein [Acidithiobacillus sp.]MCK9189625.1 hypothetical protein [Acidithiobacillus sp.]MCK9359820.1 hypothetical protein [Acidithiobacillus sp.]
MGEPVLENEPFAILLASDPMLTDEPFNPDGQTIPALSIARRLLIPTTKSDPPVLYGKLRMIISTFLASYEKFYVSEAWLTPGWLPGSRFVGDGCEAPWITCDQAIVVPDERSSNIRVVTAHMSPLVSWKHSTGQI